MVWNKPSEFPIAEQLNNDYELFPLVSVCSSKLSATKQASVFRCNSQRRARGYLPLSLLSRGDALTWQVGRTGKSRDIMANYVITYYLAVVANIVKPFINEFTFVRFAKKSVQLRSVEYW